MAHPRYAAAACVLSGGRFAVVGGAEVAGSGIAGWERDRGRADAEAWDGEAS
jgi:hypothetical protein